MSDTFKKSSRLIGSLSRRNFLRTTGLVTGAAALGAPFVHTASAAEKFVWYSGSSARSVAAWAETFQKQSGIPTEHFRSGGVKLAQKFEAEVKANQVRCSALDSSLPGIMMDWVDRGAAIVGVEAKIAMAPAANTLNNALNLYLSIVRISVLPPAWFREFPELPGIILMIPRDRLRR